MLSDGAGPSSNRCWTVRRTSATSWRRSTGRAPPSTARSGSWRRPAWSTASTAVTSPASPDSSPPTGTARPRSHSPPWTPPRRRWTRSRTTRSSRPRCWPTPRSWWRARTTSIRRRWPTGSWTTSRRRRRPASRSPGPARLPTRGRRRDSPPAVGRRGTARWCWFPTRRPRGRRLGTRSWPGSRRRSRWPGRRGRTGWWCSSTARTRHTHCSRRRQPRRRTGPTTASTRSTRAARAARRGPRSRRRRPGWPPRGSSASPTLPTGRHTTP